MKDAVWNRRRNEGWEENERTMQGVGVSVQKTRVRGMVRVEVTSAPRKNIQCNKSRNVYFK